MFPELSIWQLKYSSSVPTTSSCWKSSEEVPKMQLLFIEIFVEKRWSPTVEWVWQLASFSNQKTLLLFWYRRNQDKGNIINLSRNSRFWHGFTSQSITTTSHVERCGLLLRVWVHVVYKLFLKMCSLFWNYVEILVIIIYFYVTFVYLFIYFHRYYFKTYTFLTFPIMYDLLE